MKVLWRKTVFEMNEDCLDGWQENNNHKIDSDIYVPKRSYTLNVKIERCYTLAGWFYRGYVGREFMTACWRSKYRVMKEILIYLDKHNPRYERLLSRMDYLSKNYYFL